MSNEIEKRLKELEKLLSSEELAKQGFDFFYRKTPIKTGNARSKTVRNQSSIQTNYPYARRLDEGYSRQAPDGMTKPTIEYIQQYIKDVSKG